MEIYTETYKCPECTSGNTPEISYEFVKSQAPTPLIPHSYASASSVAHTMYQKYANAMPLYRQEKDWKQLGVDFSRATLANWVIFCAENYLAPLYHHFEEYLETDGYQGYDHLAKIKRCCWSHVRRYFVNAVPRGKEYDYSNPAVQGVQFCSKLFDHERHCKEKKYTYEKRHEYRNQKSKPVIDAFFEWVTKQTPMKGSRLEKALNYAVDRKETLYTYLEDGRCSLSNNYSELAIRPYTVGRKNWRFSDSGKGAEASAIVYTMVEMAKAHQLNIYKYLKYVLERQPNDKMSDTELAMLVPWNPDVIDNCMNK